MAIIKCPECKKEISDQAEKCIGCGYPINKVENSNKMYVENNKIGKDMIIGGGVLFILFGIMAFSLYKWNQNSPLIITLASISFGGFILYIVGRIKNWYHSK